MTDNIVVKEVSSICSCVCERATNFCPARDLFDTDTNVFESELVFWERTSKIDIPVRENIGNREGIIGKIDRRRVCKSLTPFALRNIATNELFHLGEPESRTEICESIFNATVGSSIVGLF
jgi:hypothetical protein